MVAPYQCHFVTTGSGPALLLLHGLFDSLHTWDRLVPLLSPHFTVFAIDLPGFGKSELPPAWTRSIAQTVDAVKTIINTTSNETVSVVGSSMGAGIALALAENQPDKIDRIVLINPYGLPVPPQILAMTRNRLIKNTLPYFATSPFLLRQIVRTIYSRSLYNSHLMTEALVQQVATPFSSLERRKDLIRFISAMTIDEIRQIDRGLPSLSKPVLIVWGEEDRWLSVAHKEHLIKRLHSCRLVHIPACGHLPQMEKPEAVAEAVISFLKPVGRSDPAGI